MHPSSSTVAMSARDLDPAPPPPRNLTKRLFSLEEAAEELGGVSTRTLRRMAEQGLINFVRIGARVFISRAEIDRLVREGAPLKKG